VSDISKTNLSQLKNAFYKALELSEQTELSSLTYGSIPEWDSLGHMALVSEVEDTFSIEFTTEEVINFSSFKAGIQILGSRNIEIEVLEGKI
jgi:acyl carrier protein